MKTITLRTIITGLVTVTFIAIGATAFAGQGMGNRDGGEGDGRHYRGYGCIAENLTPEQRQQLDAERDAFFEATKKERRELRAKLAKNDTNAEKASALQKTISDLKAGLDQKRLTHIMNMRKISPDAGRGFDGPGRGMEYRGHGHRGGKWGMGDGSGRGYGPGYCRQ
jgi:zinc resistance-associated protein